MQRAFEPDAGFDWPGFRSVVRVAVRMLDNVLDVTYWPLPEQRREAMNKRRIGLGFLGLGSALVMLGIRYDSDQGLAFGAAVAQALRDEAYRASIELVREKGAFPALDAARYLQSGFAKRLPDDIRDDIAELGIRNSHLLSIAPTGTIALAFADNASNGIEPAFSWSYTRRKRMPDGSTQEYRVEDHAYRLFRERGGDTSRLPDAFVSALDMTAEQHLQMLVAVQPFIDSSISKTVNVAADYPFEAFKGLYMKAWKAGLKGLATYRPNAVTGAVLSVDTPAAAAQSLTAEDDPLRKQFDSRPAGELEGLTSKVEFWTVEGKKSVYLTVNFVRVAGVVNGQPVDDRKAGRVLRAGRSARRGPAMDLVEHAPAVDGRALRRVDLQGTRQHVRSGLGQGPRALRRGDEGGRRASTALPRLRGRGDRLRAAADPRPQGLPRQPGQPGAGGRARAAAGVARGSLDDRSRPAPRPRARRSTRAFRSRAWATARSAPNAAPTRCTRSMAACVAPTATTSAAAADAMTRRTS